MPKTTRSLSMTAAIAAALFTLTGSATTGNGHGRTVANGIGWDATAAAVAASTPIFGIGWD